MTDALGEWYFSHSDESGASALEVLSSFRSHDAFEQFVEEERAGGRLHRDDTTLVIAALASE